MIRWPNEPSEARPSLTWPPANRFELFDNSTSARPPLPKVAAPAFIVPLNRTTEADPPTPKFAAPVAV